MESTTRIALSGAAGRMGRALVQAVAADPGLRLGAALESPASGHLGADAGSLAGLEALGVTVTAGFDTSATACDALIEFATPAAALAHLDYCREQGAAMVIGATGFDDEGKAAIAEAARATPIVLAPNMSIGVNLCLKLVQIAAATLGDDADVEIIEAHHRHKVDAPSGTALRLGEVAAAALGRELAQDGVFARHGVTGERPPKAIGFSTIRAADIVGEHTVLFGSAGERLEITHRSSDRMNYARGALRAVRWLIRRGQPGLYDMQDVLGL